MDTFLQFGTEFFYENIVSFCEYKEFKTLQCLNSNYYNELDKPFYRQISHKTKTNKPIGFRYEKKVITQEIVYRNGLVKKVIQLSDGTVEVPTFSGNIQHGPWKSFYDLTLSVILEDCVKINGIKIGLWKTYSPSKRIVFYGNEEDWICTKYNGEVLNGLFEIYHDSILQERCIYNNGRAGNPEVYYNFFPPRISQYNDSDGAYKVYFENGVIVRDETFKNNDHIVVYYDENGNPK